MKGTFMFDKKFSFYKTNRKIAGLLSVILGKDTESESPVEYLCVADKHCIASDGAQIIRMEIAGDDIPKNGLYALEGSAVIPLNDNRLYERYPDVEPHLDYGNFTKTATLKSLSTNPLLAVSFVIQEFGTTIGIDHLGKVFTKLASFNPEYARVYGHADPKIAKNSAVKIEMLFEADGKVITEPIAVEYLVMPMTSDKEDYVVVDNQPMLFDIHSVPAEETSKGAA